METLKQINPNLNTEAGKTYVFTYSVSYVLLATIVTAILDTLKGLIGTVYSYAEGKEFKILSVLNPEETSKIVIRVKVLTNPAPIALIGGVIVGLLFLFGSYLVLDKVEEVVDNPVIGSGVGLLLVGGGLLLISKFKALN